RAPVLAKNGEQRPPDFDDVVAGGVVPKREARGRSLPEFGPLAPLLAPAAVTDLFVNGDGGVWVDEGSGAQRREVAGLDEQKLRELAVQIIAAGGRHVDEASPCVDVRLRDGIRVHAVLPPVSTVGTLL